MTLTADEKDDLFDRYNSGYREVIAALNGITDDELDVRPRADAWTAREVCHHLADSETNSYVRLRRLLAEEGTTLQGYDEALWARTLAYDRPVDASLAVFAAVRASSAELIRAMGDVDWGREGVHTESGRYTLEDWLRIYADHAYVHADQIRRARRGEA